MSLAKAIKAITDYFGPLSGIQQHLAALGLTEESFRKFDIPEREEGDPRWDLVDKEDNCWIFDPGIVIAEWNLSAYLEDNVLQSYTLKRSFSQGTLFIDYNVKGAAVNILRAELDSNG